MRLPDLRDEEAGRPAILYIAGFALTTVVLALLSHFGLADSLTSAVLFALVLAAFVAAAYASRTMDATAFFVAERSLSATTNGIATAAAFLSGAVYLGLAGAFFANRNAALALTVGWSLGFVLLSMLLAPFVRRSGAYGVGGFLAMRYGGRLVRLVSAAVVVAVGASGLAAAFAAASLVGRLQFGLDHTTTAVILAATVGATVILGGMRSVSTVGVLQYATVASAFLAPAILVSTTRAGVPVPHLSFGLALQQAAGLAAITASEVALLPGRLMAPPPDGVVGFVLTMVTVAAGVATLPHLVMRSATVSDGGAARRSVGWALIFVLVVVLAAPTYAAFARLGMLTTIVGAAADLPEAVAALAAGGYLQLCDAGEACAAMDTVAAPAVAIGPDTLMLAWPALMGLPHIATALLSIGAITAILAVGAALAVSAANAVGHDIYGRLLAPRASVGRRMIVTRLAAVALLAGGAWFAGQRPNLAMGMAAWGTALAAGGLFPAMTMAVWWRRANVVGAIAGIVVGTGVTGVSLLTPVVDVGPLAWLDPAGYGLPPVVAGAFGGLAGTVVAALASLATARPPTVRLNFLDAVRRPNATIPDLKERD